MNQALIDAFRYWRGRLAPRSLLPTHAANALLAARHDVAEGRARSVGSDTRQPMRGGQDFKIGSDSVFWCECPDAYLRRVGFADECGVRLGHKG